MDFSESTKVVYNRIQKLEPENVSKIIGYLLLQGNGERDMIRLAFGPDNLIQALINKAKTELGLSKGVVSVSSLSHSQGSQVSLAEQAGFHFTPYLPASTLSASAPAAFGVLDPHSGTQVPAELLAVNGADFVNEAAAEDYALQNQMQFLSLEDQMESSNSVFSDFSGSYFYPESAFGFRTSRRSPSLPEFPVKVCHYFNKGFCKHGNNCRYFHCRPVPESFSKVLVPSSTELPNEDHDFPHGSLEKLEMEITELLKLRRGIPISIASLPMMYYEKYGKTLQAEGYLTESQRQGKAGYSLTKLLARLKNSIHLIERPHGQHSVILVEDVPKYLEYATDRFENAGGFALGARQIYLTFPAESIFSEQDVSNYFSLYGPVQDVRIPCQQRRMFGFVTFVYAETVKQVLAKGNPHFVCGARVLVKPYREKPRLVDRKSAEKSLYPLYYSQHSMEGHSDQHSMSSSYDNSRLMRKQLIDDQETALELERLRNAELKFSPKAFRRQLYPGNSMDELKFMEDTADLTSDERFGYLLDVLNNASSSEHKVRQINVSYTDKDSGDQGLNLPDSPFASSIGRGISAAI